MITFLVNVWNATHRLSFKTEGEAHEWCQAEAQERQALVTLYEVVEGKQVHRATLVPKTKASPRQKPVAPRPAPEPVAVPVKTRTKAAPIVMPTVKKPAVTGPKKAERESLGGDLFDFLD